MCHITIASNLVNKVLSQPCKRCACILKSITFGFWSPCLCPNCSDLLQQVLVAGLRGVEATKSNLVFLRVSQQLFRLSPFRWVVFVTSLPWAPSSRPLRVEAPVLSLSMEDARADSTVSASYGRTHGMSSKRRKVAFCLFCVSRSTGARSHTIGSQSDCHGCAVAMNPFLASSMRHAT